MKPDIKEVEKEHVETQREGNAVGLLAGLIILAVLVGSVIFVTYFWPVFEIAATQSDVPTPAPLD
jgi:hypothetical protein